VIKKRGPYFSTSQYSINIANQFKIDHMANPTRGIIYANVIDIPGNLQRRYTTLGEGICPTITTLRRDYRGEPGPNG
jgi:hypothetical protein